METKLERIAEISANSPRPEFTSLYHLINKEMLLQCHKELDGNKAVGVDEITKKEYGRNLGQPIMFYIVNTHQLGRTCHFSKKSMKLQLKTEYFK